MIIDKKATAIIHTTAPTNPKTFVSITYVTSLSDLSHFHNLAGPSIKTARMKEQKACQIFRSVRLRNQVPMVIIKVCKKDNKRAMIE